jgi:hypothetical protein
LEDAEILEILEITEFFEVTDLEAITFKIPVVSFFENLNTAGAFRFAHF